MKPLNHLGRWWGALLAGAFTLFGHAQESAAATGSLEESSGGDAASGLEITVALANKAGRWLWPEADLVTESSRPPFWSGGYFQPLNRRGVSLAAPAPGLAPDVFVFAVNADIPDGDLSGFADTRTLPPSPAAILSVAVTLELTPRGEGGFLGDLYATLAHEGGGYAVLLNRPGRGTALPFGYSDGPAVNITLADEAPADVHQYRLTLTGSELVPLAGPLTGYWQPDGRAVDPLVVASGDPRQALLGSFMGIDAGGRWTLFVADLSGGGEYRLDSWALTLTPVPEPNGMLHALALVALGWAALPRRAGAAEPQ